jgi:hypothetical protein
MAGSVSTLWKKYLELRNDVAKHTTAVFVCFEMTERIWAVHPKTNGHEQVRHR